jgi:hypothetical protein
VELYVLISYFIQSSSVVRECYVAHIIVYVQNITRQKKEHKGKKDRKSSEHVDPIICSDALNCHYYCYSSELIVPTIIRIIIT